MRIVICFEIMVSWSGTQETNGQEMIACLSGSSADQVYGIVDYSYSGSGNTNDALSRSSGG